MARLDPPWGAGQAPPTVAWIPHALSLCGLACGFMSLLASTSGDFGHAAAFIIAAVFFDGFDGAAARALHAEGPFGESMDSLADLVAFGVAPAFLVYQANLKMFGTPGAFAGAAFAACGAIRLARFPLVKRHGYFVGLPIPMAGAFVAMLGVFAAELPELVVPFLTLLTSALMVSAIQFPYFGTALKWLPPALRWAACLSLAPLLFILAPKTILFLLALYLSLGPVGAVRRAA
ncbi:MAG TPA: CDP-diacylglycerol--serine O-phosphatidyltransferase [Chloroflexota bacterium]|nr:CDP-diacylglycerol--serine O-phosphatidyltransferase [Chloroflexota bacterium]